MNNKLIKSVLLLSVAGLVTACDFEEKNTDPSNSTTIEPGPLLTYTQMNTTTGGATKNMQVGTCMMLVQILYDECTRKHILLGLLLLHHQELARNGVSSYSEPG